MPEAGCRYLDRARISPPKASHRSNGTKTTGVNPLNPSELMTSLKMSNYSFDKCRNIPVHGASMSNSLEQMLLESEGSTVQGASSVATRRRLLTDSKKTAQNMKDGYFLASLNHNSHDKMLK